MPIYLRYCPGNIVDITTLKRTMAELKENGINTKFALLDTEYYPDDNLRDLFENYISFVTRLKLNRVLYKNLVKKHLPNIQDKKNLLNYNNCYVYIKCVECNLVDEYKGYAYICLDIERKSSETHKLFEQTKTKKLSNSDVYDKMQKQGVFVLVSSRRIARKKLLPIYYTRTQIEQIFDLGKNYADLLPLRIQMECPVSIPFK